MCGISVAVELLQNRREKDNISRDSTTATVDHERGAGGLDDYSNVAIDASNHLSVNGRVDKLQGQLNDSLELIKHRGPDSRGTWISKDRRVALGHVRLSIVDLSEDGAQPFHDPEDTVHAVVNGELYEHERIRAELIEETGYQFNGHSDSEIVVALYKHYGLSFLDYLRGEFSLCLYDSRTQLFIAVRDRYGIKPLFWTVVNGKLLVAAEIKAFLPFGWQPEWDVKSLLEAGWNHDSRTIFKDVRKVRPGHYLTCESFGRIEIRQYWEIEYNDKRTKETQTEEQMIEGVRSLLIEAIRLRLRADVPVGVYLSGGIDSSAIAGIITHLVKEKGARLGTEDPLKQISCFSIAFDKSSGFDESDVANRTAEWLNVKFHKKHISEQVIADSFEEAVWHTEHQYLDLNFVGKFVLSEAPREHGFKVVLTGEGADEQFAGYNLFLPDYLLEPDLAVAEPGLPEEEREEQQKQIEASIKEYYTQIGADSSKRQPSLASRQLNHTTTVSSMTAFEFGAYAPWTYDTHKPCDPRLTAAHSIDGRVRRLIQHSWHPLHTAMYTWQKGHLANCLLTCLGDRTEMAHSVEARTPFLDHRLTEYVNRLPPSVKFRYDPARRTFTEKWILREAVKPFITKELYERQKHPYSAPVAWPPGGPLHRLMKRLVTFENVQRLGFVDWDRAKTLVEEAFDGASLRANRQLVLLAAWIVLSHRFGINPATPGWGDGHGMEGRVHMFV